MQIPVVYLTVLVVSSAGLVFELLFGTVASYLLGDSITQFATLTGLFLSAMGVGAWLTRHVETEVARRLVDCQLAAALVGGVTAPILFLAFARVAMFRAILFGLVALTGTLVGALVPLILRLLRRKMTLRALTARVLTLDYAGALVGSLAFGLVLLPHLGMVQAGLLAGAAAAGSALWGTWALRSAIGPALALRVRASVVFALLTGATGFAPRLMGLADEAVFSDPVIYARQSEYQRIVLTRGHGGINLFLDNNLQFSAADEYRYHEALVHPAFAAAPRHARVLVLGGGDGLATREILRHLDVESVTLVDLDGGMTDLARTSPWLVELNHDAFHEARVHVVNADAMVWLAEDDVAKAERFDVAVVDFPDPNNFALGKLFTSRFYKLLRARVADDAVIVVQATSPLVARRSFWCIVRTIEAAGYQARPYHAFVPSFGEWGFVLASPQALAPVSHVPPGLRYLTDAELPGLFVLAPDMGPVPVEVNRLNNQVLVHYYEEEWRRFLR
jgi:spermidine synthase